MLGVKRIRGEGLKWAKFHPFLHMELLVLIVLKSETFINILK